MIVKTDDESLSPEAVLDPVGVRGPEPSKSPPVFSCG